MDKEIGGAVDPEARKFADTGVAWAMATLARARAKDEGLGITVTQGKDALLAPLLRLQVEALGQPSCLVLG